MKIKPELKKFLLEFLFSIGFAGIGYLLQYDMMFYLGIILALAVSPGRAIRNLITKKEKNT